MLTLICSSPTLQIPLINKIKLFSEKEEVKQIISQGAALF